MTSDELKTIAIAGEDSNMSILILLIIALILSFAFSCNQDSYRLI